MTGFVPSARTSSVSSSGHDLLLAEQAVPGTVPRFEIGEWREHGIVAGITGRGEGIPGFDLGLWTMQPVGQVMQRWRDLRRSLPDFHGQVFAIQCHGADVAWHQSSGYGWRILESLEEGGSGDVPETQETLPTPTGISALEPIDPTQEPKARRRRPRGRR